MAEAKRTTVVDETIDLDKDKENMEVEKDTTPVESEEEKVEPNEH